MNTAANEDRFPAPVQTLDSERACHVTQAALQEAYDEHVRRTRKENPETHFTHYFNETMQKKLHQHRTAYGQYLKSLDDKSEAVQIEAINGVVQAWDRTLPNQLVTITSQLSSIVGQKWYGSNAHEAALLGVVDEIAYCAYRHKDNVAMSILRSALSPHTRIGSGTKILDYVAGQSFAEAARDMQSGKTAKRALQYLPAALRA